MRTRRMLPRMVMRCGALLGLTFMSGCICTDDLLSWTPLWWLVNRPVRPTGSLRRSAPEISTRNYIDGKKIYRYRLTDGVIDLRVENGTWHRLPGGNPRDCSGRPLRVRLIAADNNRLFAVAEDRRNVRSLWWYCVKDDQAEWSETLIAIGGDLLKKGYRKWTACAHNGGSWTNLLALREFVPYKSARFRRTGTDSAGKPVVKAEAYNVPRASIDVDDVVDIAVGHWTGTVVTYYVLMGSTGKIMYIDEEVVMDRWKTVPYLCRPCNSPYPLDSTARIAASNSVVCAYTRIPDGGAQVSWIRWDFHNRRDFRYYPLDWCEHRWHTVDCPVDSCAYLTFNTHWPDSIRDTIWEVPKNRLNGERTGFLGTVEKNEISAYRVEVAVRKGNRTATLLLDTLDYKREETLPDSVWEISVEHER